MVGKTTFIYANSTVDDKRVGISRRVDMQGTGVADFPFVCDNSDGNTTKICPNIGHILKLNDSHHKVQDARFDSYIGGLECELIGINSDDNIGCDGAKYVTLHAPAGKTCSVTMGDFKYDIITV